MGINGVTGVSNHLIRGIAGLGLGIFVYISWAILLPALAFYTMYDSRRFILWQRFRCLESEESKFERAYCIQVFLAEI